MTTTIRVSDETKSKLETLKRGDESFDELLDRLTGRRTPRDVEKLSGAVDDPDFDERVKKSSREVRNDFEEKLGA